MNFRKYFVLSLFLISIQPVFAQVKNTATVFISSGAIVYSSFDFINGSTASYQNNGNLYLTGNFSNNQIGMAQGAGTTSFVGTSLQLINGPEPSAFYNLTLNNTLNVQMSNNASIGGVFKPQTGSLIIRTNRLTLNGTIDNSPGNTGTLTGSSTSVLDVGGTGDLLGKLTFASGGRLLYDCTVDRPLSGLVKLGSDLDVNNILTLTNGAFAINGNTLTLSGTITSTNGTISGSSTSKLTVGGSGGGNVGILNFTAGAQTLNTLTMNRTGGSNARALMGTNIASDNFVLTNGLLVTANNLVTWNNSGGTITSPNTPWVANSTSANNSYIATCDASGVPLTFTSPFNGSKGFRINNISGGTNVYFPVGADFKSANRMLVNNNGTADNFTVVIGYGDIVNTPLPRVNRIWYINSASGAGIKANMQLFFTKQNPANYGVSQDEVETGFNYADLHLIQKDYSQQFVNNSNGADVLSFLNNITYPLGSEIYATYNRGISQSLTGTTNGVNGFTRFSVVNANGIILPLTFINLKAYQQLNDVNVEWTSVEETNIDHYEIERATDGINFSFIGKVAALKSGALKIDYKYTDGQPFAGNNFYRILAVENSGRSIYSNTVLVHNVNLTTGINVYPNPVTNAVATLQYRNIKEGNYTLVLYSTGGQKVWQTNIQHPGGNASYTLKFPATLAKGIYHLEIKGDNMTNTKLILIQ